MGPDKVNSLIHVLLFCIQKQVFGDDPNWQLCIVCVQVHFHVGLAVELKKNSSQWAWHIQPAWQRRIWCPNDRLII